MTVATGIKRRTFGNLDVDFGMASGDIERPEVVISPDMLLSPALPAILNMLSSAMDGHAPDAEITGYSHLTLTVSESAARPITVRLPSETVKLISADLKMTLEKLGALDLKRPEKAGSPSGTIAVEKKGGRWQVNEFDAGDDAVRNPLKSWLRNNAIPVSMTHRNVPHAHIDHYSNGLIDVDTAVKSGTVKRLEVIAPPEALATGAPQEILAILYSAVIEPAPSGRSRKSHYRPNLIIAENGGRIGVRIPADMSKQIGERSYDQMLDKIEDLNLRSMPQMTQEQRREAFEITGKDGWTITGPAITAYERTAPQKLSTTMWDTVGPGTSISQIDNHAAQKIYVTVRDFTLEALEHSPVFKRQVEIEMEDARGHTPKEVTDEVRKSFLPTMARNRHGRTSVKIPERAVDIMNKDAQEEVMRELEALKAIHGANAKTGETLEKAFPKQKIRFTPLDSPMSPAGFDNKSAAWTVDFDVTKPKKPVTKFTGRALHYLRDETFVFSAPSPTVVARRLATSLEHYYNDTLELDTRETRLRPGAAMGSATDSTLKLTVNGQIAGIMPEWAKKSPDKETIQRLMNNEIAFAQQYRG